MSKTFEARVKKSFLLAVARACAGTVFNKTEWKTLEDWQVDEANRTDFLEVREVKGGGKKATKKKETPDGVSISKPAQEIIDRYGLDPELREGAGALIPTVDGKINKPTAELAAEAFATENTIELDALALAVENEIPLEQIVGTGDDDWIELEDVEAMIQ